MQRVLPGIFLCVAITIAASLLEWIEVYIDGEASTLIV